MRLLLFLSVCLVVSNATSVSDCLRSEGYIACQEDCQGLNGCSLASCNQECQGNNCEVYCEDRGCPPGNQDDSCLITCLPEGSGDEGGDYHICSNSHQLVALLALAFA